ncbi:Uncharacterized protein GBIM_10542 [Gryllus bimaculatus]|nr:Uncharacterized protein GBIM_10542 [Gryllus bimaculatus]
MFHTKTSMFRKDGHRCRIPSEEAAGVRAQVETSAFSGLTNVEHLIFPSGIRSVEPDAFSGLDTVGLLKLAFMDLTSLKPHTFRGLSHVHVLAIQESDLGVIRTGAFEGLTQLVVSGGWCVGAQVGSLNLLNNKIDALQELAITRENAVRVLRLHGNHLLENPRPGAVVIEAVDTLSVMGNHFPCDCHIHSLLEGPLANSTVPRQDFRSHNFCISPLELNGQPMSALDLDAIGRCQEKVTRGNLEAAERPANAAHGPAVRATPRLRATHASAPTPPHTITTTTTTTPTPITIQLQHLHNLRNVCHAPPPHHPHLRSNTSSTPLPSPTAILIPPHHQQ